MTGGRGGYILCEILFSSSNNEAYIIYYNVCAIDLV